MATSKQIYQHLVTVLPTIGSTGHIYYVPNGNGTDLDEYLADSNGQLRYIGARNNNVEIPTNYVHTQGVPENTWIINHNLNYYPNISIVDSAGSLVVGDITYTSINSITASFSGAFSGKAYLS